MKRKLLKSVLVALALVTGSIGVKAATGDVTTNVDIDFSKAIVDNTVNGTVNSITIGQNSTCSTEISSEGILVLGNGTHTVSLEDSELAGTKDVVTISFDLAFGKLVGKSVGFNLLDASSEEIGSFSFTPYASTLTNTFGVTTDDMYFSSNTVIWERKVSFVITLNYLTRKITTYTKCYKGGASRPATESTHEVEMTNNNPLKQFVLTSNYNNTGRRCQFDNLVIKTTEGDYSSTNYEYTIKYVDEEGNAIKDPATRTGLDGESISLLSSDKSSIVYEGVKYVYSSDDCEGKVVSSSETEVTIKFRKAYTATLNINTIINGVTTPSTISLVEADDYTCKWKYTYPLYASKDGVYYKADAISTFGEEGTFTDGETINKTITYTTAENDIVYFSEEPSSQTSGLNYSNGYSGWIPAQNAKNRGLWIGTLEAGYYTLEAYTTTSNTNKRGIGIRAGTNDHIVCIEGTEPGLKSLPFTLLSKTNDLYINGKDASAKTIQTEDFDYVLIRKTGDLPSTVSLSVSDAGLATYTPSYNLDFSAASNITAYKAAVEGTTLKLTKVTTVAAGEGVLLRGKAGEKTTEDIAVATSATTANAGNEFVPVTGEIAALAEIDGDYTNFVLNKVDGVVGFYKANNTLVAAGKAYLKVLTSTLGTEPGKSMTLAFDDETTGITEVSNAAKASDKAYYTLSGQRVNAPVKGLYLHNGKKVIIK